MTVPIPVLDGLVKRRRVKRPAPLTSASSPASAWLARASRATSAPPKALSANRGRNQANFKPGRRDLVNTVEACSSRPPAASYASSSTAISHKTPDVSPRGSASGAPGSASSGKTSPQASSRGAGTHRTCKRKKREPYAPPSAQLLAKLAAKFPRLDKPRTGDG